ncbi:MAG: ATP synthase subunit I [Proteobacteria bacterium]|nr:ATP synthase subunit I [Pseudomonadota bacterium]MBU1387258.1 ATP synthase subunit I [Pseudomonadota bacterium]MBU1544239.1 ATP synthase subunit I [Pseudomonadota bacterium]MBU2480594.1 ATP synthase subunit I [Pseudomonadota bacterium]
MQDLQKIVNFVTKTNWLVLLVAGSAGLMMAPVKFAMGIILGGLIVVINFHFLKNTLKNRLNSDAVLAKGRSIVSNVLIRYCIRFVATGVIIALLISKHIVHPLGLVIGLSVVVASIFLATALELKRIFFKEAV